MSVEKLRLIVLTHGGVETALQSLLALDCAQVVGVFVETEATRRYGALEKFRRSIRYDGLMATALKFARKSIRFGQTSGGVSIHDKLLEIATARNVPVHFVSNFHSGEAITLLSSASADLGVVLGTNILKESVFKIPRLGSINLHQGLAPFYRGGPPVFWELYNGEREVGLTVHFVESKVDTGPIILQESVPLAYDYSHGLKFESFISEFRRGLALRSANLVARAVRAIADGTAAPWQQDINLGRRYRLPVKKEKDEMRRRLRERRAMASLADRAGVGNG
jgi:folate-dependent phosphoribosylglycinamide formyltransferase PurN